MMCSKQVEPDRAALRALPTGPGSSPFRILRLWLSAEIARAPSRPAGVGCLSTIGEDGFPNARFVDIKDFVDEIIVITGSLTSRKGSELRVNAKAALTCWWPHVRRQ